MAHYYLPKGMRYATLDERRLFYTEEFNLPKVQKWFNGRQGKTKYAVIMGKHTKIFLEQYWADAETTIIIDEYQNLKDVQNQIVDFLPEAVYYDRNLYGEDDQIIGQEIAFDLDPENVDCPVHGTLEDKIAHGQGLGFCEIELDIVRREAIGRYEYLQKRYSDLRVVYSGRGFHLHILDKDTYKLSTEERLNLAREVKQNGFHIDEWVTSGEYRLIRLPGSLNGLVSRIVTPLKKSELESFDPIHDSRCLPKFLGKATF
jgi:hypothetical protein